MSILPGLENLQNVHPLLVHFPVVLILLTLLFEGIWLITRRDHFRVFATYLLYLSALSAIAAVATGYIAANSLGHDTPGHEFVHEHRNVMLWMSGALLVVALLVFFISSLREGKARRLLIIALFVISSLMAYGADKGGQLVFEHGVGVKTMSGEAIQANEKEALDHKRATPNSTIKSDNHSDGDSHLH